MHGATLKAPCSFMLYRRLYCRYIKQVKIQKCDAEFGLTIMGPPTEMLILIFPVLLLRTPPCWNKSNWSNFHYYTNLYGISALQSTAQTACFICNYGTSLWIRFSVTNPRSPQRTAKHLPYLVEELWNSLFQSFAVFCILFSFFTPPMKTERTYCSETSAHKYSESKELPKGKNITTVKLIRRKIFIDDWNI